MKDDLDKRNVPKAAAGLRRGLEDHFESVCDAIHAEIRYKSDRTWDLGLFLPAARSQLGKLLRRGKSAADSWGDAAAVGTLNEFESTLSQMYQRTSAEQWPINKNVHFDAWESFSKNDLVPVVEAFQDLCFAFQCPKCGGLLTVTEIDMQPADLRCPCGQIQWNLVRKKQES